MNNSYYCNEFLALDPWRRREKRPRIKERRVRLATRGFCVVRWYRYSRHYLAAYALRHPVSVSIDIVARKWVTEWVTTVRERLSLPASTGRRRRRSGTGRPPDGPRPDSWHLETRPLTRAQIGMTGWRILSWTRELLGWPSVAPRLGIAEYLPGSNTHRFVVLIQVRLKPPFRHSASFSKLP